jgi:hypothetical protein
MDRISTAGAALFLVALGVVQGGTQIEAQAAPPHDALVQTITALDTKLFDAYNRCDLKEFGALLQDDLEFYHDLGGLSLGRESVVESVRKNICGKVTRELVPGTLEVYPIANYGALETGSHTFHHPGHETTEPVGIGKFIQIWHQTAAGWKLSRVVSFDHHALPK